MAPHEVYEEETGFGGRVLAVDLDFLRVDAQHLLLVPQHVLLVAFPHFKELGIRSILCQSQFFKGADVT